MPGTLRPVLFLLSLTVLIEKKLLILDMDETLIHCVDDIDKENPDYVIPIYFPDEEEPVHAGINVRPFLYECLQEAKKYFQIIIFTASH